jgi:hypothetical protein
MNGIVEAVAELGQGSLVARAVEPSAGEGPGHTHETACLNCGTALVGSHCHACGQAAHVHRTLGAFFHDLLHGVLHFEGKVWHTLPLLAWRPGRLTREYIDGRRARYVSPIALFLFVVFLTFALFHAIGGELDFNKPIITRDSPGVAKAAKDNARQLDMLARERAVAEAAGRPTVAIDRKIDGVRSDQAMMDTIVRGDLPVAQATGSPSAARLAATLQSTWAKVRANPALMVYKLQTSAYKYSWLLIPISVPFLWLLFPFSRRFRLYDHTVFVTYSLSFMLILIALASLGAYWSIGALVLLPILYAPFHMYRQLRGAYSLGRAGAVWRTAALLIFAGLALTMFALVLVTLATSG